MAEPFQVGDRVLWARAVGDGTYGEPVEGRVLSITAKRVKIEADHDGNIVVRSVAPERLQRLDPPKDAGPKPAEPAAWRDLRLAVQVLAQPARVQLALIPDDCIPHGLEAKFERGLKKALGKLKETATIDQRQAIAVLVRRLKEAEDDPENLCNEESYVRDGRTWKQVRRAALDVLDAFGWPEEAPDSFSLYETVEAAPDELPNSRRPLPRGMKPWAGGRAANLQYHRALFEMLDIEPVRSEALARIIAAREAACGRPFPASVVELLSIRGIFDLFHANSNNDNLVAWGRSDHARLRKLGRRSDADEGYLRVGIENQGVVRWYVRLDIGPDPEVIHDNDEPDDYLPAIGWVHCADTFSEWVFDMMTVWRFQRPRYSLRLHGRGPAPTPELLAELAGRFNRGPATDRGGLYTHRFFTPHGLLKITNDDPSGGPRASSRQALWSVDADSPDALAEFASALWTFGGLGRKLTLDAEPPEAAAEAEEMLDRLRSRRGR